jgi:hypothetical protein
MIVSDFYIEQPDGERVKIGVIEKVNDDGTYEVRMTAEELAQLLIIRPDLAERFWRPEIKDRY